MSADWAVGDLALCVDDSALFGSAGRNDLMVGHTYEVLGMEIDLQWQEPCLIIAPARRSASVIRFRKIRPDEHEACEPEFVTLLKRRKVPLTRETAEQIRRWRQEDADNGIIWEDSTKGRERQRFGDNPLPSDR